MGEEGIEILIIYIQKEAEVHGVAKSQTRLSDFTFTFHFHALEKEMATHSSVLAWRIPWTEKPGGLPSTGSHRVGHNWSDLADCKLPQLWASRTFQGPYFTYFACQAWVKHRENVRIPKQKSQRANQEIFSYNKKNHRWAEQSLTNCHRGVSLKLCFSRERDILTL